MDNSAEKAKELFVSAMTGEEEQRKTVKKAKLPALSAERVDRSRNRSETGWLNLVPNKKEERQDTHKENNAGNEQQHRLAMRVFFSFLAYLIVFGFSIFVFQLKSGL